MSRAPDISARTNTITPKELLADYKGLITVQKEIDRLARELAEKRTEKGAIFRRAKKAGCDVDALKNVIKLAALDDEDRNRLRENEDRYAGILGIPLWRAGTEDSPQGTMLDDDPETMEAKTDVEIARSNQEGYNARYDGSPFDNNPYTPGSHQAMGWGQGWKHADGEIEDKVAAQKKTGAPAAPQVQQARPTRRPGRPAKPKTGPGGAPLN